MGKLNVANRTLAVMDNLAFLRRLNNECIDLIAIDPPFAANETFTGNPRPPISDAEYAEEIALAQAHGVAHNEGQGLTRVHDIWSWDEDVHPAWKMSIEDDYPSVHAVIQAVEACASENEAAYSAFMAARLLECRRVLKPAGSIYLHCDTHANSYLRQLMDAVFGANNFRNEIAWCYSGGRQSKKDFPKKHDTILRYSKTSTYVFNADDVRVPYDSNYKATAFAGEDTRAPGRTYIPNPNGKVVEDWWRNIPRPYGKNHTGYSTQKPLELYERIIKASSNPGDVVLDIFAGCATTAIAAENLKRQWVACDMAYRAWTMLKRRFYLNGIALDGMTDTTKDALASVKKGKGFQEPQQWTTSHIIGPGELPERGDTDPAPHHALRSAAGGRRGARQSTQSSGWSGRISKDEAKQLLMDKFGPQCWGCGYEPRRPNGSLDETLLEVDHIRARRAAQGTQGNDELYNLALLHRTCNGIKRNRMTLEELRHHNAMHGLLYVEKLTDLVDLYEATQFAAEQIAMHTAKYGL